MKKQLQFLSFLLALTIFVVSLQAAPRLDLLHHQSGHKPAFYQGDQLSFNAILEKDNKQVQSNYIKSGAEGVAMALLPIFPGNNRNSVEERALKSWLSGVEAGVLFAIHTRHKQRIFPYHSHL